MIWMRISDPRSLRSWKIKWTDDSTGQKFIGSFGLPWSKWSGNSDPSKSLSSQRSTHPKWHRFLSKQFIGQTPLHLPQVQLSLESSHTQASSHCWESNVIQVSSAISSLISGMYGAGIRDAVVNRWSQQVSISAASVGMLSLLDFLELGSSNCQIETTAKRAGIRHAFVVKHYK